MLRGFVWLVLLCAAAACEPRPRFTEVTVVAGADSGMCWPFATEPSAACAEAGADEGSAASDAGEAQQEPDDLAVVPVVQPSAFPPPKPVACDGGSVPFDRRATAAALGAVDVQPCKVPNGPTGSGRITLTFDPSGSVKSFGLGAPYGGSPTGSCIAARFRVVKTRPFCGSAPVTVSKGFSITP